MRPIALRDSSVLAAIAFLYVAHVVLAMLVVPAWQNPDEPQHFAKTRIVWGTSPFDVWAWQDADVEREVFASMDAAEWWRYVRMPRREPPPRSFREEPFFAGGVYDGMQNAPPAYYLAASGVLSAGGFDTVPGQYYALRVLSALLGLATLAAVWAGARTLTGSDTVGVAAAALLALHPQFVLSAIAVNPDALINLCGAVVFWGWARSLRGVAPVQSLLVSLVAATVAVLTKRSGAPLLLLAALQVIAMLEGRGALRHKAFALTAAAGAALAGLLALAFVPALADRVAMHWDNALGAGAQQPLSATFAWDFMILLLDSAWLKFGWMAYDPPSPWTWTARVLTVAAIAGAVVALVRPRVYPRSAVATALTFVVIQVAAVYVAYYLQGRPAQGRYLFPVVGAWMVLLWIGLTYWCPRGTHRLGGAALIGLALLMNVIAWSSAILPAFIR